MKRETLSITVSVEKAIEEKLKIPSDCPTRLTNKGDRMYVLSGPMLVAEESDFDDIESVRALDKAIAADLGIIKRDDPDTGSKAGQPKGLLYVLKNGGMRLNYNKIIMDGYRPAGGAGITMNTALGWASINKVELFATMAADPDGTRAKIMEAYLATKS